MGKLVDVSEYLLQVFAESLFDGVRDVYGHGQSFSSVTPIPDANFFALSSVSASPAAMTSPSAVPRRTTQNQDRFER
jgi:hypothetical protein